MLLLVREDRREVREQQGRKGERRKRDRREREGSEGRREENGGQGEGEGGGRALASLPGGHICLYSSRLSCLPFPSPSALLRGTCLYQKPWNSLFRI